MRVPTVRQEVALHSSHSHTTRNTRKASSWSEKNSNRKNRTPSMMGTNTSESMRWDATSGTMGSRAATLCCSATVKRSMRCCVWPSTKDTREEEAKRRKTAEQAVPTLNMSSGTQPREKCTTAVAAASACVSPECVASTNPCPPTAAMTAFSTTVS